MRYATQHGYYEIDSLPGCRQVAISSHSYVYPKLRGQGYGTADHAEKLRRVRVLGFDYVICTVRNGNEPQEKILTQSGWKKIDSFTNRETGNEVNLWGLKL